MRLGGLKSGDELMLLFRVGLDDALNSICEVVGKCRNEKLVSFIKGNYRSVGLHLVDKLQDPDDVACGVVYGPAQDALRLESCILVYAAEKSGLSYASATFSVLSNVTDLPARP